MQIFNLTTAVKSGQLVLVACLAGTLAGTQMVAGPVLAEERNPAESSSVTRESDRVTLEAHHRYQSPADRANDALLVTEVKSALADDGVADGSPIVIDCDHGKILLSGVMKSAEDARRAGHIAAGARGVTAVNNQLTWRR